MLKQSDTLNKWPQRGKQPFTLTHTHSLTYFEISISPNVHVFSMWEETGTAMGGDNASHC